MLIVCSECGHAAAVSDTKRGRHFVCAKCGGSSFESKAPEKVKATPLADVIPEGKCKKCGAQIPEARLLSKPGVKFCIEHEPRPTKEVNTWVPRGVRIPTGYDP